MALPPFVTILIRDIFRIALASFVAYFFADLIKPGLVTNYINLNALLLFVIGVGVAHLLTPLEKSRHIAAEAVPLAPSETKFLSGSAGRSLTGLTDTQR